MHQSDWAPELSSRSAPPISVLIPVALPAERSPEETLAELRRSPALDMSQSPHGVAQALDPPPPVVAAAAAPGLVYHPGCDRCCALQRCHWCGTKPGPVVLLQPDLAHPGQGIAYHACAKHAALFESTMELPPGVNPHTLGANCPVRPEGFAIVRPLIA